MAQKKRHHYLTNKLIYLMLFVLGCSEVRFSQNDSSVAKNEGCDFWGRFVQVGQAAAGFAQFVSDNCSSEKTTLTCTQTGFSPPVGQLKPYCVKEKCEGADPVIGKFVAFYADTENSGDPRVPTNVDVNLLSQTNRDPRLECKNIPIQDLVWSESMPLVGKSNKGCLCTQSKDCLLTEIFNTSTLKCEPGPTLTPTATSTPTGNPNRSTITHTPTPSATGAPTQTPTSTITPTATPTVIAAPVNCPEGYLAVLNMAPYTDKIFCVAQYEAKQAGSKGVSLTSNTPWIGIDRDSSRKACEENGSRYSLITNAEWQTVARTIEGLASNWSGGQVGVGFINRGWSRQYNDKAAPETNEKCLYNTGVNTCAARGDFRDKRTHSLQYGGTIWDLAGNAWEWVADENRSNFGRDAFMYQVEENSVWPVGELGGIRGSAKILFGPSGDYSKMVKPWDSEYGGLGFGFLNYNAGGVFRGGGWSNEVNGGIFNVYLHWFSSTRSVVPGIGFRCVYHP